MPVYIFDEQDQSIRKFGNIIGSGNGQLIDPEELHLTVTIIYSYVAEYSNNRIQVFDVNGNYLHQFGRSGSGNGQLYAPVEITTHND